MIRGRLRILPVSKLDDLIEELCPDGVVVRKLSDVCRITNGKDHKKLADGDIPVYGSGGIMRYVNDYIYNKQTVLIPRKGSIGNIFFVNTPFWAVDTVFYTVINNESVLPRFLYYILTTKHLEDLNFAGGVPSLTKTLLDKVEIPLPPLIIQEEIVRILDKFTELEDKLRTELDLRKKQYEYYRDSLLDFSNKDQYPSVRWMKLGDIVNFRNGKGHERMIVSKGSFIVINSKYISTDGDVKKYSHTQLTPLFIDDIVIVMSDLPNGKALAKCYLVDKDKKYTLNQRIGAVNLKSDEKMITKFLFYFLNRNKQLLKYDNGVDQTNLKKGEILNIKIPIPPLSEQERIVNILDHFDKLTNDISVGLPAEIAARHKQYEYYRDKLLSFG